MIKQQFNVQVFFITSIILLLTYSLIRNCPLDFKNANDRCNWQDIIEDYIKLKQLDEKFTKNGTTIQSKNWSQSLVVNPIKTSVIGYSNKTENARIDYSYINQLKNNLPIHLKMRKQRIIDYCNKFSLDPELRQVNSIENWKSKLWYDYKYKYLYCQISKASSSAWIYTLLR